LKIIMQPQDGHPILRAEVDLETVDGIVCHVLGVVPVVPKSGLMGDDEVHTSPFF
jgi:hypothetical protein